ncbi:MAG: DUF1802 family protein [Chloroflexi bacterium]|nr:DUF1802 family protein [Chloroflexota bacterium]MCI0791311.1 DUF1802 family protein [Chloroflexota bacterium]MCI0795417.1 DUF1802 family protein [Chloroflexota bacterium]MCI0812356.1 DUF1802 family protein [Chloroflexota bacterium]MCI0822023.1 DUF1802 family protein [Chloroflexota bacterium]
MMLPPSSDLALKEWAVAVKALSEGKQILILRKGGIHIDDREFRVVHPEFLLYPTFEHQNAELVKPEYQDGLQQTLDENDVPGLVSLGYWCQVTDKFQVSEQDLLDEVSPYHIWTTDYANKRLHWRPKQPVTIALLRVYELQQPQALPVLDEYAGCKSWVELGQDVPLSIMTPVLSDQAYEGQAEALRQVLGGTPTAV